jgi:hypothetical protein
MSCYYYYHDDSRCWYDAAPQVEYPYDHCRMNEPYEEPYEPYESYEPYEEYNVHAKEAIAHLRQKRRYAINQDDRMMMDADSDSDTEDRAGKTSKPKQAASAGSPKPAANPTKSAAGCAGLCNNSWGALNTKCKSNQCGAIGQPMYGEKAPTKAPGSLKVAYMSVGTMEKDHNKTQGNLQPYTTSNSIMGEKYLKITENNRPKVEQIMKQRIDTAKKLGYNSVEMDNMDLCSNIGNKCNSKETTQYLVNMAKYANQQGMGVVGKNAPEFAKTFKENGIKVAGWNIEQDPTMVDPVRKEFPTVPITAFTYDGENKKQFQKQAREGILDAAFDHASSNDDGAWKPIK